jgi:hypothetical protein
MHLYECITSALDLQLFKLDHMYEEEAMEGKCNYLKPLEECDRFVHAQLKKNLCISLSTKHSRC